MPVHRVPRDDYETIYASLTRDGEDILQVTFDGDEVVFLTVTTDRIQTRVSE